jgi:hypothetical protein
MFRLQFQRTRDGLWPERIPETGMLKALLAQAAADSLRLFSRKDAQSAGVLQLCIGRSTQGKRRKITCASLRCAGERL